MHVANLTDLQRSEAGWLYSAINVGGGNARIIRNGEESQPAWPG